MALAPTLSKAAKNSFHVSTPSDFLIISRSSKTVKIGWIRNLLRRPGAYLSREGIEERKMENFGVITGSTVK